MTYDGLSEYKAMTNSRSRRVKLDSAPSPGGRAGGAQVTSRPGEPEAANPDGDRRGDPQASPQRDRDQHARRGREALVSEATAYRYFPDLARLLREADEGGWPDPAEALAWWRTAMIRWSGSAYAAEFLLRGMLSNQGAVRAMISASITKPPAAAAGPGTGSG